MNKGKNIVLGVTGGVAAYKAADIVSRLVKKSHEVDVIMTKSAQEFISELTFRSLSNRPVVTDMFGAPTTYDVEHISLAKKADVFVIAPATANIIGKIANGIADDMLSTTLMATEAPVLIAPAMNTKMYCNPIVQENIEKLKRFGYHFIEPESGRLACGDVGSGKLAKPEDIVSKIDWLLNKNDTLKGKRILISAGPTVEDLDPVRFISNRSSGKMGYAIANNAFLRGAEVTLVSGPVSHDLYDGINRIEVRSSEEMYNEIVERFADSDIVIKAAAVLDYRPKSISDQKIKKSDSDMSLELSRTKDILKTLGEMKKHQLLIGFAAETDRIIEYAKGKLVAKNADMIVANDVSRKDIGFISDENEATIVLKDGTTVALGKATKDEIASNILNEIIKIME